MSLNIINKPHLYTLKMMFELPSFEHTKNTNKRTSTRRLHSYGNMNHHSRTKAIGLLRKSPYLCDFIEEDSLLLPTSVVSLNQKIIYEESLIAKSEKDDTIKTRYWLGLTRAVDRRERLSSKSRRNRDIEFCDE